MNAIGISLSGIRASSARIAASATNIAQASATGPVQPAQQPAGATANLPVVYRPVSAEMRSLPQGGVASRLTRSSPVTPLIPDPSGRYADIARVGEMGPDLTEEMAEMLSAKLAFGANLAVLRTVERLDSRFINRMA